MSYQRVIPRDLFNEASLLKCYGRLYILSETTPGLKVETAFDYDDDSFNVEQDPSDGAIYLTNVYVSAAGVGLKLRRPLNSRSAWPLVVVDSDDEAADVFTDAGDLTPEFLRLLAP